MSSKKVILIILSTYLPGYKAGGPIRSIKNLIEKTEDKYEFCIITSDRDVGDDKPYRNVKLNEWTELGGTSVYYLEKSKQTLSGIRRAIRSVDYDAIYINSLFSKWASIYPMILLKLGRIQRKPIILAPRGELSTGALMLKSQKKKMFLRVSKFFDLYRSITWQASSNFEKNDITEVFDDAASVVVARNIASSRQLSRLVKPKLPNSVKVVFISRISPKKNLDYVISILQNVSCKVVFDIYGPKEDLVYFEKCRRLILNLPSNISANFKGPVLPNMVQQTFEQYDLFFFPTKGENFGHVIAESLCAGVPVLTSDQTPWRGLCDKGLGADLPLDNIIGFQDFIENFAQMSAEDHYNMRINCSHYYNQFANDPEEIERNIQLFDFALAQS